nr:uncharacterized protein LOC111428788 [Onthophagus taurus]
MWEVINKERSYHHAQKEVGTNLTAQNFSNYYAKEVEKLVKDLNPATTISNVYVKNTARIFSKSLYFNPCTKDEIINIINHLKTKKGEDVYGHSTDIVKKVAKEISEPLCMALNKCIEDGVFPERKHTRILPIYKKGDCSYYRPIALLPVFSKIFEELITYLTIANMVTGPEDRRSQLLSE